MTRGRFERLFDLLVAALMACAATSLEGTALAATAEPVYRYLFVVDTSFSMASRAANVRNSVYGLIRTGINGRIKPGEPFGIWTFNERVDTATFVRLHWDPLLDQSFANKAYQFLTRLDYERQTHLDRALVQVLALARDSERLTIFFYSDGQDRIVGTPFDDQLNSQYAERRRELRRARAPFVTVLNVRQGEIVDAAVHAPFELVATAEELAQAATTGPSAEAIKLPDRTPEQIPGTRPPAAATESPPLLTPQLRPTAPPTVTPSVPQTEVAKTAAPAVAVTTPPSTASTAQPTAIPPPEKSPTVQTQPPAVSPQPLAPPTSVESPKVEETPKSESRPVVVEKKPEDARAIPPVSEPAVGPPITDGPTAPASRPPANAVESSPVADIPTPVTVAALGPEKKPSPPAATIQESPSPPIPVAENRGSAIPPMATNNVKAPARAPAPQAAVVAPGDAAGGGRFLVLGVVFLAIAGFLAFLCFRGNRSRSRPSLISRSLDRDNQ